MFNFKKNKVDKVAEILEKEADYREENENYNISASKRKVLDGIEELVIKEEAKKNKIGKHEYVLLALIAYLFFFPLFFLSFLIPTGVMVVLFVFYYKADKKSNKYQFEHKFWNRMFKEQYGV